MESDGESKRSLGKIDCRHSYLRVITPLYSGGCWVMSVWTQCYSSVGLNSRESKEKKKREATKMNTKKHLSNRKVLSLMGWCSVTQWFTSHSPPGANPLRKSTVQFISFSLSFSCYYFFSPFSLTLFFASSLPSIRVNLPMNCSLLCHSLIYLPTLSFTLSLSPLLFP